jgi:glycosyltransferase involved in cell wall biosynthesis
MRIVIALQGAQVGHRSCLELVQALCRLRGEHEIIIALDGHSIKTIEILRGAFHGILPQDNIRLWHAPTEPALYNAPGTPWRITVAKMVEESFLASLYPDMLLLTGAVEATLSADFCAGLTRSILLPAAPSRSLSELGNVDGAFFLAPSEVSRKLWIELLDIDELRCAAIAEKLDDSFEQQALRVLQALESWYVVTAASTTLSHISERRPRLAYVSPLPPERTGISDYSAELLQQLIAHYEIDVVVEQAAISDQWIKTNCFIRNTEWFREHAESYDRVLYHIGNSPFHLHMFDLLGQVPGVVVLHDFFLSDILDHLDRSGIAPGSFVSTLYRSHGYTALKRLFDSPSEGNNIALAYPCNFDILQQATGVILHSLYAKSLAATWYGSRERERCEIIPLLRSPAPSGVRDEARLALGFAHNDVVVCSFGMLGAHKQCQLLLDAWLASKLADDITCILVYVGEAPENDYCRRLQETIGQSPNSERIRMTGWIPIEEYHRWLAAADIGVQLRTISRGESSASVLDCMNYGLATIVNANGSMAELPEECVLMLPEKVTVDTLGGALETLRSNASLRQLLGDKARTFVQISHSPKQIAEHYAAAIERFSHSPEAIRHTLLQQLACYQEIPDDEINLFSIAEGVAKTFPDRCAQQQLLIDVSALVVEDLKTGIQRVVRSVVTELLEHPPEGFRVEPVFMVQGEHGLFYRYARQFTLNVLGSNANTRSLFHDEPIEVHSGDIFLGLDLCHNVRHGLKFFEEFRRRGGLVYFVVYDLLPLLLPHCFPPDAEQHHSEWMEVVAQGDGVLCISRSVADDVNMWFERVQPQRYRPFKIGWFHLGADIENSLPTTGFPEGFDEDIQKFAATPTIIMVGTVEPRKGHDQALKAFELLWMTGVSVNLVIAGKKGWMVDQLADRIREHKELNHKLFWYEKISDEALQRLYEAADGVMMASEGEGFGLPLIEAAQHGCPILARDLPVFREVATQHASWFSGHSRLNIASSLIKWVSELTKGTVTPSAGMPWMTWKESTEKIISLLMNSEDKNWVYQWEKSSNMVTPLESGLLCDVVAPKTVAVDLTPVLPGGENGGAKVFVLELIQMLAEMKPETMFILLTRESSHQELSFLDRTNVRRVTVLYEGIKIKSTLSPGLRIISWSKRTARRWKKSVIKRLKGKKPLSGKKLRDLNVDLLYCPFTSLHLAEPGIPAVCTIHDLQYKTYPEFFTREDAAHRDRVFMEACRRATALTAVSEYSRESAIAHGNLDPSRIRTIYHRLARRISPKGVENTQLLDNLGLSANKYLLYPANFWKHKNHEMLLAAFGIACSEGLEPEIKLVCTGASTERQQLLIGKTRTMGLEDRVLFPGYLPNDELAQLLSNCSGMIFPSLYEGFGLPVIEAMAAGVPVACSNTRSLPEVAFGAALLFDPENPEQIAWAMLFLAGKEPLREQLIEEGLHRASTFSNQEQMAREYWELFEDALSEDWQYELREGAWSDWCAEKDLCMTQKSDLKVSIVTPSFNQGQFIGRSLMSVANQKGPAIEHVVFDASSTDSTIDVLRRFSPTVKWVSESDNGQGHAVNKGIRATSGDIIGWLNSDDIYYPDAIARVVTFFEEHPEIDVVYGQADHIDVYDSPFEPYPTEPWNFERLHDVCFICQPALFFRRRVAEQYGLLDESLQYCMDYEYWLRLGKAGVRFAYIEEKLAGSRLYADNKTLGSRIKVHREINDMFRKKVGKVPKKWLKNYSHLTMLQHLDRRISSRTEFSIRYFFAKLRWGRLFK